MTFADERGKHEIWYEDTKSIEKKLWLAKYYGLQGVTLWHMGNFTGTDWIVIQQHTHRVNLYFYIAVRYTHCIAIRYTGVQPAI